MDAAGENLYLEEGETEAATKKEAQEWLTQFSEDLAQVCSLAGMSGEEVKFLVERYEGIYGN
jgi:hypothetical protein